MLIRTLVYCLDSDAIPLDFNLSIEELLATYKDADIIASADIKLGLINTGILIIRNTQWARSFLRQWWEIADRNIVCDQEAFDKLYRFYLETSISSATASTETSAIQTIDVDITRKIKILPTDALNSHPPAWKYQQPGSRVLHLMGESSLLRQRVFRKAFSSVCAARSGGMLLPQLGVDSQQLLEFAM